MRRWAAVLLRCVDLHHCFEILSCDVLMLSQWADDVRSEAAFKFSAPFVRSHELYSAMPDSTEFPQHFIDAEGAGPLIYLKRVMH